MNTSTKHIIKISVLLIVLLSASAVLLKEYMDLNKRSYELGINLKRTTLSNEISGNITKMVANIQDYIVYFDQKYLDDFRRNSSVTIKHQLELYNIFNPSKKQEVEELIEFTKAYISFVEKEVVPAVQSKKQGDDIKYILIRHKDFIRDIYKKTDTVAAAGKGEMMSYYEKNIVDRNDFIVLVMALHLLSLTLLIVQAGILIRPVIMRRLYLEKLAGSEKSAVIIVNRRGVLEVVNQSARNMLGIPPEVSLNKNLSEITAAFPHLHAVTQPLIDVIAQRHELTNHRVTVLQGGKKTGLLADYTPVFALGFPVGALMVAVRAEEKKHKQLLLDTLETERKRISIEIHDWIGRYMSTMIHSLDYVIRLSGGGARDHLSESLATLRGHCQSAAIEMRGIMNNIHPYLIDKVGLIPALESYISTFEKLNNIKVYIMYQDRSLRVKKRDEIIIYRIIQEALTNVARHGRSTEVDVEFALVRDTLRIDVSDNGGPVSDFVAGKGLWGMKERANLIGGEISFSSTGSGFCVTLTVPIIPGGQNDGRENQNNAY